MKVRDSGSRRGEYLGRDSHHLCHRCMLFSAGLSVLRLATLVVGSVGFLQARNVMWL